MHQRPEEQSREQSSQPPAVSMPPEPGSSLGAAIKGAIGTALAFAGIAAISTKIPLLNKLFTRDMATEAKDSAIFGAVLGGFMGYEHNQVRKRVIHPLEMENVALKQHIINANHDKTFAQRVGEEKMVEQDQQPKR